MRRWIFVWPGVLCLLALMGDAGWAAEASPPRDRWYLEDRVPAPVLALEPVVGTNGLAPARDRWYLEGPESAGSPAFGPVMGSAGIAPARDRWYLEP